MEVDDAVLFDLAKLCDQYQVERLHNHCLHQLFTGLTVQNAVMRLVQAHTASCVRGAMWVNKLKSAAMRYMLHATSKRYGVTQGQHWSCLNMSILDYMRNCFK
jgi:hypothetical protein